MIYTTKIFQARENEEEDVRTIDSAVGSGSVAESTSLNIDVQSEASDTTVSGFLVIKSAGNEDLSFSPIFQDIFHRHSLMKSIFQGRNSQVVNAVYILFKPGNIKVFLTKIKCFNG